MEKLNFHLLRFFTDHYKPGVIGIVGTKGTISIAIREAQKTVTTDGETSLWSHCFIFGDLRLDRRGEGGTRSKSPYIFESDLKVNVFKPQLRNGAQENWIGKYCRENIENAGMIGVSLTDDQRDNVLSTAFNWLTSRFSIRSRSFLVHGGPLSPKRRGARILLMIPMLCIAVLL